MLADKMETEPVKKLRWYQTETDLVWSHIIFIMLLDVGGLYFIFTFPYLEHPFLVAWAIFLYMVTIFGITAGVHRLWAHRTYKATLPLRIILAICFYSTIERFSIYGWVRVHRQHHKYSDTAADPHNSTRGFWYSHVGWLMMKKSELVRERAKGIDMRDVAEDPVVQFFDRHYTLIKTLLLIVVPLGVPVYFFGASFKWTFMSHFFLGRFFELQSASVVNSFAHLYGARSYDESIRPRENKLVSFLTIGEGFHNYHHTFPWDYRAAEVNNFMFNLTTLLIDMFAKINWAYDMKHPTQEQINSVLMKKGDGTHPLMRESILDKDPGKRNYSSPNE